MPNPTHQPAKAAAALTPEIVEIFGAPPLLSTEDAGAYDDMLAKLAHAVHPGDIITCLLIKDIADKRTEIARYRRQKAALVEKATQHQREGRMERLQKMRAGEVYLVSRQLRDEAQRQRANVYAGGDFDDASESRVEGLIED